MTYRIEPLDFISVLRYYIWRNCELIKVLEECSEISWWKFTIGLKLVCNSLLCLICWIIIIMMMISYLQDQISNLSKSPIVLSSPMQCFYLSPMPCIYLSLSYHRASQVSLLSNKTCPPIKKWILTPVKLLNLKKCIDFLKAIRMCRFVPFYLDLTEFYYRLEFSIE